LIQGALSATKSSTPNLGCLGLGTCFLPESRYPISSSAANPICRADPVVRQSQGFHGEYTRRHSSHVIAFDPAEKMVKIKREHVVAAELLLESFGQLRQVLNSS
jgi:hypothetical protein